MRSVYSTRSTSHLHMYHLERISRCEYKANIDVITMPVEWTILSTWPHVSLSTQYCSCSSCSIIPVFYCLRKTQIANPDVYSKSIVSDQRIDTIISISHLVDSIFTQRRRWLEMVCCCSRRWRLPVSWWIGCFHWQKKDKKECGTESALAKVNSVLFIFLSHIAW